MFYECVFYKKRKLLLFSCVTFLIVHLYKFTNYLPNWDSLMNGITTSKLGTATSGRWFSGIAEIITSSKFDLQWVGGVAAAVFVSLSIVLIIDLFDIRNKILQAVTVLLFVAFPTMAATFNYSLWVSGYMLGLFLAVAGVYICIRHTKYFYLSIPCFTLSIGIYQVYILFAAVAVIYYFVNLMLNPDEKIKNHKKLITASAISFLVSGILYLIINKIVLSVFDLELTSYQGISDAGKISLDSVFSGIKHTAKRVGAFFLGGRFFKFYGFLNILIALLAIILVVWKIVLNKKYSPLRRIVLCIMLASVIPITYSFYFLSAEVEYHRLMELGNFFLYLIPIIIFCNNKFKFNSKPLLIVLSVLIGTLGVYHFVNDNIGYYQLSISYERTYFQMSETITKMDSFDSKSYKKIAVSGKYPRFDDEIATVPHITGTSTDSFVKYQFLFLTFAKYYLNRDYVGCTDAEIYAIQDTKEFAEMSSYPNGNYVSVIGDTLVVKLSE